LIDVVCDIERVRRSEKISDAAKPTSSEKSAREGVDFVALLAHFEKTQKAHRVRTLRVRLRWIQRECRLLRWRG
jgi:hypothetical protein